MQKLKKKFQMGIRRISFEYNLIDFFIGGLENTSTQPLQKTSINNLHNILHKI